MHTNFSSRLGAIPFYATFNLPFVSLGTCMECIWLSTLPLGDQRNRGEEEILCWNSIFERDTTRIRCTIYYQRILPCLCQNPSRHVDVHVSFACLNLSTTHHSMIAHLISTAFIGCYIIFPYLSFRSLYSRRRRQCFALCRPPPSTAST
jgi:hypothetical protein